LSYTPVEDELRYYVVQQIEQNFKLLGFHVDIEIIDRRREKLFPVDAKITMEKVIGLQFKRPDVKANGIYEFKLEEKQHQMLRLYPRTWFFYAFPLAKNRKELINALCRTPFVDPCRISLIRFQPKVVIEVPPIPLFTFPGPGCQKFWPSPIARCQQCPVRRRCVGQYAPCIVSINEICNDSRRIRWNAWPLLRCKTLSCKYGADPNILDIVERFIRENIDARFVFIAIEKGFKRVAIFIVGGEFYSQA